MKGIDLVYQTELRPGWTMALILEASHFPTSTLYSQAPARDKQDQQIGRGVNQKCNLEGWC